MQARGPKEGGGPPTFRVQIEIGFLVCHNTNPSPMSLWVVPLHLPATTSPCQRVCSLMDCFYFQLHWAWTQPPPGQSQPKCSYSVLSLVCCGIKCVCFLHAFPHSNSISSLPPTLGSCVYGTILILYQATSFCPSHFSLTWRSSIFFKVKIIENQSNPR